MLLLTMNVQKSLVNFFEQKLLEATLLHAFQYLARAFNRSEFKTKKNQERSQNVPVFQNERTLAYTPIQNTNKSVSIKS